MVGGDVQVRLDVVNICGHEHSVEKMRLDVDA